MSLEIDFENHIKEKIMEIKFKENSTIESKDALLLLKSKWRGNLKFWHAPYTCLFDIGGLVVNTNIIDEFKNLLEFFKNFHMRKLILYYDNPQTELFLKLKDVQFIEFVQGYDNALKKTRLFKDYKNSQDDVSLKSKIKLENDFQGHVIELSFSHDAIFSLDSEMDVLFKKIKLNLLLWHSPYSLVIDCQNLTIEEACFQGFERLEKFIRTFYCKKIVGYSPKRDKTYPFKVFRSRHLALSHIEGEGLLKGDVANCQSRSYNK